MKESRIAFGKINTFLDCFSYFFSSLSVIFIIYIIMPVWKEWITFFSFSFNYIIS